MNLHNWIDEEFSKANYNDKRLKNRFIEMAKKFDTKPESSIPGVFNNWAETKAAYRFFNNPKVTNALILNSHSLKTLERVYNEEVVLAVQDTSYFTYGHHKKTQGLGYITKAKISKGQNRDTLGLIAHTTYAVKTNGIPLGILDQKIFSRDSSKDELTKLHDTMIRKQIPIELKESNKWLEPIEYLSICKPDVFKGKIVHVCDREGDFFDLFWSAKKNDTSILVRAEGDRVIGKPTRSRVKPNKKLFNLVNESPVIGKIKVELPEKSTGKQKEHILNIKTGSFELFPNRSHPASTCKEVPKINLNFVYASERSEFFEPNKDDVLEWLIITNLEVQGLDTAIEKINWYKMRWQIESFHKILKSGFNVESCRISEGNRLSKYLTLMSIMAWKIHWLTYVNRINPSRNATEILSEDEISVLQKTFSKPNNLSNKSLNVQQAVILIARLGGFLNRKSDGNPGFITIWRGWFRLTDIVQGYVYMKDINTYG